MSNYIFQTANSRSAFSDYKVISHLDWCDKNGTAQVTDIVLTISNWHFNRDTLKEAVGPTCKMENVMVTLKLSSSVFEPSTTPTGGVTAEDGEAQPAGAEKDEIGSIGEKAYTSSDGDVFYFDKNGCIIPFVAFNQLLDSDQLESYLAALKKKFEAKPSFLRGPSTPAGSENDEEDLESVRKKRLERKRKLNMLYSKNKKNIEYVDEDGNDDGDDDDDGDDGDENQRNSNDYPHNMSGSGSQIPPLFEDPEDTGVSTTKATRKRPGKK